MAVVVDVANNQGMIRFFDKETDDYVNGVGIEEAGNLVIVPWDSKWWAWVSGSLRIGYIVVKDAK